MAVGTQVPPVAVPPESPSAGKEITTARTLKAFRASPTSYAVLILVSTVFFVPFILMFSIALSSDATSATNLFTVIPREFEWSNFSAVFTATGALAAGAALFAGFVSGAAAAAAGFAFGAPVLLVVFAMSRSLSISSTRRSCRWALSLAAGVLQRPCIGVDVLSAYLWSHRKAAQVSRIECPPADGRGRCFDTSHTFANRDNLVFPCRLNDAYMPACEP